MEVIRLVRHRKRLHERRRKRQKKIICTLEDSKYDVWYIKKETGYLTHLSIDGITVCPYSSGLVSFWDRYPNTETNFCWDCLRNIYKFYLKPPRRKNMRWIPKEYEVKWRCSAIVNKKGKKKRCFKTSDSPFNSFCLQHKKCFLKHIQKYTSISQDVCKLIISLL